MLTLYRLKLEAWVKFKSIICNILIPWADWVNTLTQNNQEEILKKKRIGNLKKKMRDTIILYKEIFSIQEIHGEIHWTGSSEFTHRVKVPATNLWDPS